MDNLAGAFIVDKEKRVIFPDGTAEASTKLVADQNGLLRLSGEGIGGRSERSNGVEDRVAQIIVSLAVKLVRAAADADVDDGASGAAILCTVVVGLNAELRDCVG